MCACLVEEKEEENRLGKAAQPEKKEKLQEREEDEWGEERE